MIGEEKLQDVARMLVETDKTTEQIGEALGIGRTTARNYINRVYAVYGLSGEKPKRHLLVRRYYELRDQKPGRD